MPPQIPPDVAEQVGIEQRGAKENEPASENCRMPPNLVRSSFRGDARVALRRKPQSSVTLFRRFASSATQASPLQGENPGYPICLAPFMYGTSTSGTVTVPSAFW
jgi:hypothetical protein